MPVKSKADLIALKDLTPEDRADIASLFDTIEKTNGDIDKLRKQKDDADKIVAKQPELEKLLADKTKLSGELQEKLSKLTTKSPVPVGADSFDDLLPFKELRDAIEGLFDGEPEPAEE